MNDIGLRLDIEMASHGIIRVQLGSGSVMESLNYYSGGAQPLGGFDPNGIIAVDFPCRYCGQNLRGQHFNARCPGCSKPVGRSLYGEILQYADPAWLQTVRAGLLTVFWTSIGMIVAILGLIVAVVVVVMPNAMAQARTPGGPTTNGVKEADMEWLTIAGGLIGIVTAVLILYGLWRATAPDPSAGPDPSLQRLRSIARGSLVLSIVISTVSTLYNLIVPISGHMLVSQAIGYVAALVYVATWISTALYLRYLAARVPDLSLANRAKLTAWGGGISWSLMVIMQLVMLMVLGPALMSGSSPNSQQVQQMLPTLMAFNCMNGIVGLAVITFVVLFLVTIGQIASRLKAAKEVAAALHALPPAPATPPPMA